jgi:Capsule polysaccharide biosynthesis protein
VARQIRSFKGRLAVFNIKPRYADWEFKPTSVVWAGKGQRKSVDMRFAMLQQLLSDSMHQQVSALRTANEAFSDRSEANADMRRKMRIASGLVPPRVALFLPRLDQPWGTGWRASQVPPLLTGETIELRLHWAAFAARLANAVERKGVFVDLYQVPARLIQPAEVDASGSDLALVPHRCHLDFSVGQVPVRFYMQEYFRWLFVVDAKGWSAASSSYPIDGNHVASSNPGAFDDYRHRLGSGLMDSKFSQPARHGREELVAKGLIPARDYLFFPLQIPHDQSIRYFADVTERVVVEALLAWSSRSGVPIVFKPHPANPKSMREFELLAAQAGAYWSTAHIHDLIAHARAVATINSGVGFEALLQTKPVITFGRAEYDCVTFHATTNSFEDVWRDACACSADALESRYRRFVDWFLSDYAVDLSRPQSANRRIDALAHEIAVAARVSHASRLARLEHDTDDGSAP